MWESLGLGKKSSGPDTKTWSWFRLPIPKPGFGCTLMYCSQKLGEDFAKFCGLLRIYELYLFLLHFCLMKNWIHIGLRLCPLFEKHVVFKIGASFSLRYILFLGGLFLGLLPWQHSRFQKVCCHPHSQWENKCKIHLPWQCSYSRQILGRSCRWTSGHTYGWNKRSSHKHILPIR